jgi:hypothetical protein
MSDSFSNIIRKNGKNIQKDIYAHIDAYIADLIEAYIPTDVRKREIRRLAYERIICLINMYTKKIRKKTEIYDVYSIISSSGGYFNILEMNITCSVIWLIENTQTHDSEQIMADFVINLMFGEQHNQKGMNLISVGDKIPKIYEPGLYEVNDRALNLKSPKDLIRFIK